MKHTMRLFLADRKLNKFMSLFDMKPDYKWFITELNADFETDAVVDEAYFMGVIEKSKSNEERWIPAISAQGKLFVDPSVKVLSDGETEFFV